MTFKKWWIKRPSWLKGGVISLGLAIILVLISLLFELLAPSCQDCFAKTSLGYMGFILVVAPATLLIESSGINIHQDFFIFIGLLFYFFIGAFIGWIDRIIRKTR